MSIARHLLERAVSIRVPMSREEWLDIGEVKHHEWSDGVLYVNPPNRWHVLAAKDLARALDDVCPPGFTVYPDWGLRTPLGDFEPDLMIAAEDQPDGSYSERPPLLVVEITSPTTRDVDGGLKRRAYATAQAGWYWIVDKSCVVLLANNKGAMLEVQRIEAGAGAVTIGPVMLWLDPANLTQREHVCHQAHSPADATG